MYKYVFKSANTFFKELFGCKVYKLALDAGMTCPNRDGTVGEGGCIFCSAGGSGEFAEKNCGDVHIQIERAKARLSGKSHPSSYIAYFQSFTNTYADADILRSIFLPVINNPEIAGLSIATRPDCLPGEVINLIEELNCIKPVFIELGLQTIHENTAKTIRRGYALSVYDKAVFNLKKTGVHIITHMILGLPGENNEMMIDTARYIGEIGSHGVKLQLLHVLKGTDLEKMYLNGEFSALSKSEYIKILVSCMKKLPQETVIHRITGDAPKDLLTAPLWSADKKRVLQEIYDAFSSNDILLL